MEVYSIHTNANLFISNSFTILLQKLLSKFFESINFVNNNLFLIKTDKCTNEILDNIYSIKFFKDREIFISKVTTYTVCNFPLKSHKWIQNNHEDDFLKNILSSKKTKIMFKPSKPEMEEP